MSGLLDDWHRERDRLFDRRIERRRARAAARMAKGQKRHGRRRKSEIDREMRAFLKKLSAAYGQGVAELVYTENALLRATMPGYNGTVELLVPKP